MKRIISFILTLAVLVSTLPLSVSAAEPVFSDTDGSEYYYVAASELASREILTGYPDGSFGAEKTITRAEAATVICRMIGKDAVAKIKTESSYYTDVAIDHWALGYINLATDDKIISGDGNGIFRPEDNVNYQEAIKLVVCAAGYGDDVEIYAADWSLGYINVANDKGITANIIGKKDEALTRGDIAVLVYNAVKLMDAEAERQLQNAEKLAELNGDEEPGLYYEKTGQLGGFVGSFYDKKITDGDDAKASLELLKDYIGIDNIDTELEFVNSYESGDLVIYVMNQIYKGVTVYGHEVRVKTDKDGNAVSMISGFLDVEAINTKPTITKEEAIAVVATEHTEGTVYEDGAELVIYADANEEPYLAYIMELELASSVNNYFAVVDAHSGEIKEFHSMGESLAKAGDRGTGEDVNGNMRAFGIVESGLFEKEYTLVDNERKITTRSSIYDPAFSGIQYSYASKDYNPKNDGDKNGDGYNDFQLALTAHANVAEVFDYYRDVHKHTYINNDTKNSKGVEVVVPTYERDANGGISLFENAYADTEKLYTDNVGTLGFGVSGSTFVKEGVTSDYNYATAIDVVAHEFTHLVFAFKAPAVYGKYEGLNGSINEAYADIMGEFAEAHILGYKYPDWKHGASVYVDKKYRDIADPLSMGYPEKFEGDNYQNPDYITKDKGGVHNNSTIISHAAYLMSEKIPTNILGRLWYNSMDNYSGLCDFTHVRNAVLMTAKEMKIPTGYIKAIEDAFNEVNIGDPVPYATFYTVENTSKIIPISGATIELKSGANLKWGPKNLALKTGDDGKVKVIISEIPYYPLLVVKRDGYVDRELSYDTLNLGNSLFVISLSKHNPLMPETPSTKLDEKENTDVVTISYNGTPLYSVSNVIKHEKTTQYDVTGEESFEEESFECELPVTITAIAGGDWFEIMDWTPSIQTGQSANVGFIMPDNCPGVEAYEYDDTGEYSWNVKPKTTYTIDQPGYYYINIGYSPEYEEGMNPEDYEYMHLGGVVKIEGQRTADPSQYRVLENAYMYDEAFYGELFKYGTEVPLAAQDGYYTLNSDCDMYIIYLDGSTPQGAAFSFEPVTGGEEFNATYSVLRDTNWRNIPQPAVIGYGSKTLNIGEIGVLTMHVGDVKISATGIKVVGIKIDGTMIPAGREMMYEASFDTTIVGAEPYSCSYEVYYGYDSELYGELAYSGTDLSTPINLKVGQKIKIKSGSQDVKINHPRHALHLIAYLSKW